MGAALALLGGFVFAEFLCRVFFVSPFVEHPIGEGILFHPRWGVIHQPGAHYQQKDVWESVEFEVRINQQGFRNREIQEKSAGAFRVVVMGDSFTEGFGVAADEAFPAQAERLFREAHPDVPLEVVNSGTRGGALPLPIGGSSIGYSR